MKLHERTMPVARARAEICLALIRLQEEHDLTDIEMLQAIGEAQALILKYMLRAERHPNDPEAKGDEAGEATDQP